MIITCPLYRALGGTRPRIGAYASALLWEDDLTVLAAEARSHCEAGFRTVKMRLGRDHEYDRAAVSAVKSAIGPDNRVAVDGTHRYSITEAAELAEFLAGHDVAWFEEPFPPEDIDTYAQLREMDRVPVAAGGTNSAFRDFASCCGRAPSTSRNPMLPAPAG